MRINFRQGLISFQRDNGVPAFIGQSSTSGFLSHIVSQTPTVIAFAHGTSDYLMHFDRTVDQAWGPMVPGVANYLFWDLDVLSAEVSYGITVHPPITAVEAPSALEGQHWFDLNTHTMKVWSTSRNKWLTKIRVFAGVCPTGNTSVVNHYSEGTQVGLAVPSNPGFIMRDVMLQPLRKSNGEFLTDDTHAHVMTTAGTSGVLVQPVNRIVPIRAGETIPAMSLVYFSSDDTVRLASSNPALVPMRVPVGIITENLMAGESGNLSPFGEITYDQWDWSGHAGEPLYIDTNGALTLTRPSGLMAYRVGFVKNHNTVLLGIDAETFPQVYQTDVTSLIVSGISPVQVTDTINGLGERVVTVAVPTVGSTNGLMTPAHAAQLSSLDSRVSTAEAGITALSSSKANAVHTHVIADTAGLQAALDNKANTAHTHTEYAAVNHTHTGFASAVHVHTIPDVDGLQDNLNLKANRQHLNAFSEIFATVDRSGANDVGVGLTLASVLSGKADATHVHTLTDVSGLQTALNGKADATHGHTIANITGLQTELDSRAYVVHNHTFSNISGLQAALDGKASLSHTHIINDVSGLQAILDGKASLLHPHTISDVSGLQTALDDKAFNVHVHAISNVTGLQSALDSKAAVIHLHELANVNGLVAALADKAAVSHNHQIIDVAGLQATLDGKAPLAHFHTIDDVNDLQIELDNKASATHAHAIADVTGLQVSLDGKAAAIHVHAIADVTGLQTELTSLQTDVAGKAEAVHAHAIADVTSLQTELDGKASATHVHAIADVTGLQTELDGKASVTHAHAIADVTGLQTELDGKASATHVHAIADVTGLQTELTSLQTNVAGKAEAVHVHAIAAVTGLQTELDGKASATHVHAIADVTGLQTELTTLQTGLTTVQTDVAGKANTIHVHSITDVSGLSSALSGKANLIHTHGIADVTGLQTALDYSVSTKLIAGSNITLDVNPTSQVVTINADWAMTPNVMVINSVSTNYMVDVSDTATLTMIRASSPTAITVTLPDDTTAIQVGAYVVIGQSDVGQVTIAGAAGVTVNYVSTNTIAAKHGKATAIKVGPNEWDIYGDLV